MYNKKQITISVTILILLMIIVSAASSFDNQKEVPTIGTKQEENKVEFGTKDYQINATLKQCDDNRKSCDLGDIEIIIINETKFEFGGRDLTATRDKNYKYIYQSNKQIKQRGQIYYIEIGEEKRIGIDSIGKTRIEIIKINTDDICNLKDARCEFKIIKDSLEVSFTSKYNSTLGGTFIDPHYEEGKIDRFKEGIVTDNVTVEEGLAHLTIDTAPNPYELSNNIIISDATSSNTDSTTYVKIKELIAIGEVGKDTTLRIEYDYRDRFFICSEFGGFARFKVYNSGVAVGTEQTDDTGSFQTFSEDIIGWNLGDTIELWAACDSGEGSRANGRDFEWKGDLFWGLGDELVGYYPFDGEEINTESVTFFDYSTSNNSGTGINNAVLNETNCLYGNCLQLDGIGDYVNITITGDKISTTLWYKNLTGVWIHVAFNGTDFFVDGVVGTPNEYPINISDDNVKIGVNGSTFFAGLIDEVMIFNTTITSKQVSNIYNNQSKRFLRVGTMSNLTFNLTLSNEWIKIEDTSIEPDDSILRKRLGEWNGAEYLTGWNGTGFSGDWQNSIYFNVNDSTNINWSIEYQFNSNIERFHTPTLTLLQGSNITLMNTPNVTECGILGTDNANFELQNDITVNPQTCFTILGDNMTFNLNNKVLTSGGGVSIAIKIEDISDKFTAVNSSFIDWQYTVFTEGDNGIYKNFNVTGSGGFGSPGSFFVFRIISDNNSISFINISNSHPAADSDSEFFKLNDAHNNKFDNIFLQNNTVVGAGMVFDIRDSEYTIISNSILNDTFLIAGTGNLINLINASHTTIYDSFLGAVADSKLSVGIDSINVSVVNITISSFFQTGVANGSELFRKWYYRTSVNDSLGNPVEGINITALNITGDFQFNLTTDSNGLTEKTEIIEWFWNGSTTQGPPITILHMNFYSNYTISASEVDDGDSCILPYQESVKSLNVTDNILNHIFTINKTANWDINCVDNCIFNDEREVPRNLSLTGVGSLTVNNKVIFPNSNQYIFQGSGCELRINSGGSFE